MRRLHVKQMLHTWMKTLLHRGYIIWMCWSPLSWHTRNGRRPDGLTLGPWYKGLSLVWDATVVDTFAQGHYKDSARQAGFAATNAEAAKCQKYHDLQTSYHLQPVAIETTCVYGKSTAPLFWVVLRRGLLMCLVTPGSANGSTSVFLWLWSGEMLPAYWPVCEFDLTLCVLFLVAAFNILITITAYHLLLYHYCLPNPRSFL